MMRSLSSAVTGLRAHQTKMDVIGNNIANVNTYGFKSSRTTFSDMFYQTLSGASGNQNTSGGTNPTQIGYGSAVASIDVMNSPTSAAATDRALDVYLTGDGFLVTQDSAGNYIFTRNGNLGFDEQGYLVDASGQYVMGFPQRGDGSAIIPEDGRAEGDSLQPIHVDPALLDQLTGINIGSGGEIVGTLPGGTKVSLSSIAPEYMAGLAITEGSKYTGDVKMVVQAQFTEAQLETALTNFGLDNCDGLKAGSLQFSGDYAFTTDPMTLTAEAGGKIIFTASYINSEGEKKNISAEGRIENGKLVLKGDGGKEILSMELIATDLTKPIGNPTGGADVTETIATADLAYMYQATVKDQGGNIRKLPSDTFTAWPNPMPTELTLGDMTLKLDSTKPFVPYAGSIGRVGTEESELVNIGNLVLAKFRNASGLLQSGSTGFTQTSNSGEAIFLRPGAEGTGSVKSGMLEMSNVDISKEFTDMITTQRGFQANTRIVTVSDEMLQELVNLKR